MKSWKKQYFILLAVCMFSCGCGQGEEIVEETEKEPAKTILAAITPMEKISSDEEEAELEAETILNKSDGFPINLEIEIDVAACNAMNRKLTREKDSGDSLFCLDKDEVIYFVNQNQDDYLYCIKDGKTELVVDLPVKEVYPWEDVVYFMIAAKVSEELEEKAGDIYCYVPATKEVKLVYALGTIKGGENHKMTVNEQGIHFNYSETIASEGGVTRVKVSSYTLPFGAAEPVKDTVKIGKAGWGEYYFSYEFTTQNSIEPVKVSLVSRTKGSSDTIALNIGDFQYCVVNDTIYSTELGSSAISLVNLQTQKKNRYDFRTGVIEANSYLKEEIAKSFGDGIEEILSFTTTENGSIIWATDGEYLYRMDTQKRFAFPIETSDVNRRIEKLYTDGRRVYGLYAAERAEEPCLVRFCTEVLEQDIALNPGVAEIEYLVPEGRIQ